MCVRLNSNYSQLQSNEIKKNNNVTKDLTQNKKENNKVSIETKDSNGIESNSKINSEPISFVDKKTLVNVAKVIPPTIASISTAKASASVVKIATETVAKTSSKAIAKTGIEKLLASASSLVATPVIKATISSTTQTAGVVAAETIATKVLQKSAQKATQKGAEKTASKLSSMVPVAGAAIGIAITAYDTKYAYDLSKDPKASKFSKAMAWTTVGLDTVATVTTATGVGSAIGWIATGLSIGTSVLAEVYR